MVPTANRLMGNQVKIVLGNQKGVYVRIKITASPEENKLLHETAEKKFMSINNSNYNTSNYVCRW